MTGFHLERATFDPFVWRDGSGRVHFNGQRPTTGRHRECALSTERGDCLTAPLPSSHVRSHCTVAE